MLRNRLLAPTVCCVGTLLMAGCYSTAPSYRPPEGHVRFESPSRIQQTSFGSGSTQFAAGQPTQDSSPLGYGSVQRASGEQKAPATDLLSRILPASPPPPGTPTEPILALVARELGFSRPEPRSREHARGLVPRVTRRIVHGKESSPGDTQRNAQSDVKAPKTLAGQGFTSPPDRSLLDQLHRDATGLRTFTADERFAATAADERPTMLPRPSDLEGPPPRQATNPLAPAPTREFTPGLSPFSNTSTGSIDVPLSRPEVQMPLPSHVQVPTVPHVQVPLPPAQHNAQQSPVQPQAITQLPHRFYHSDDYRVLAGEVQQFRNTWRLRYARVDETDQYGGSVVLAGDKRFDNLRDGLHVRVHGRIIQNDRAGPVFEVQAIEIGER